MAHMSQAEHQHNAQNPANDAPSAPGEGSRLSAAVIAPPATKAAPTITHKGPAARNCKDLEENTPCQMPAGSNPAWVNQICAASAASTPTVMPAE